MIKPNTFKTALTTRQTQLGLWCCIADAYTNEIVAGSGYDWLTLDMEHSPNDARTVLAQIQYPPRGIRGVAGLQRANQWGRVKNYHANA